MTERKANELEQIMIDLSKMDEVARRHAVSRALKLRIDWENDKSAPRFIINIIGYLDDPDVYVRLGLVNVLTKIGKPAFVPLVEAMRCGFLDLRMYAAMALHQIDPNWPRNEATLRQIPDFLAALRDDNPDVRANAWATLNHIDPIWPKSEAAQQQIPNFVAHLVDTYNDVRTDAQTFLEMIDPRWPQHPAVQDRLPRFIAALNSSNSDLREETMERLMKIGANAVKALVAAISGTDLGVRKVAAAALAQIVARQRPLRAAFPDVLCVSCLSRAELRPVRMTWKFSGIIACRACGGFVHLRAGVREVVGVIGGNCPDWLHEGKVARVRLWSEVDNNGGHGRGADIDRLVIEAGGVKSYATAIFLVIVKLQHDIVRPSKPLQTIPVEVRGVELPASARSLLDETFTSVTDTSRVPFAATIKRWRFF